MPASSRRLWALAALAGLGLIVRFTLFPTSDPDTGTFHWCVLCGDLGLADFIANVILFMPMAAGLSGTGVSWRSTVLVLLALSTGIELVQLVIPGRESALGDIFANTSGAALGAALPAWWPRRRRSGVAGGAATAGVLAIMVGAGLALLLSLPSSIYYGQWTADLGMYDQYRGRVLSAEIGGLALPSWRLDDSRTVRKRILSGVPLEVRVIAGPRTGRVAPVFSIFDERQREVLVLGADRDDFVLRVRRLATGLRLREPDARWRGAMAGVSPGDTLSLGLRVSRSGLCLRFGARERCDIALSAGEAWRLVQDRPDLSAEAQLVLEGFFMILLGLPLGLLSPRRWSGYAAIAAAVAGVLLLPPLLMLAPTPPIQVACLALGIVAGGLVPEGRQYPNTPVNAIVT